MEQRPHYEYGSSPCSDTMRRVEGLFERHLGPYQRSVPVPPSGPVRPARERRQAGYRLSTPAERERLVAAWAEGLHVVEIATELDRDRSTIRAMLLRAGIDPSTRSARGKVLPFRPLPRLC